jgi:hypothetical protein
LKIYYCLTDYLKYLVLIFVKGILSEEINYLKKKKRFFFKREVKLDENEKLERKEKY